MVYYSKSITAPSYEVNKRKISPKAPPSSHRKKSFGIFLFALAEHSLSFTGRRMFAGSFDGVRPCGGRDSGAARRKDERSDNLHPQEQEELEKEVASRSFSEEKTVRSDRAKNKCRQ
jgi:hypothetical protein